MGSTDSTCCGQHCNVNKGGARESNMKHQRHKQDRHKPLLEHGNTSGLGEYTEDSELKGVDPAEALNRVLIIIAKYNTWLHEHHFMDSKGSWRGEGDDALNYEAYHAEVEDNLIKTLQDGYSTKAFLRDCTIIKAAYHYKYEELREALISGLASKYKECDDDNCWSMKHFFLRRQKQYTRRNVLLEYHPLNDPLEILTNIHVYVYHAVYSSEFRVQHVHPRMFYVTATYLERKVRGKHIALYQHKTRDTDDGDQLFPVRAVHLISIYLAGKYMEEGDTLDKVSALRLSEFIEKTMNKATLAKVWQKLDEDGSDTIDAEEVDSILLLIAILFVAIDFKDKGVTGKPKIDKTELKILMRPIGEWMKSVKFTEQTVITKEEFRKTFSSWLREYHDTNGGIIADPQEQLKMLQKYRVKDEKNGLLDAVRLKEENDPYNRLVINCEYLKEHVPKSEIKGAESDEEGDDGADDEAASGIKKMFGGLSSGGKSWMPSIQ
mmetsp:Transcript_68444/g.108687  ORF Transcript_68444/g.108687 Transcript_68444/m.108687 type:complete len:492 (-) Transcript_68444:186-1661(-)